MRFIRENLFIVVLLGATVVVGGVAVGYYLTLRGELNSKLRKRTGLSGSLARLAGPSQVKVSEEFVQAQQRRIDALMASAKKDSDDGINFNRRNLPMIKLNVGAAMPRDAFPIDEKLYSDLGLNYVFIKEYTRTLDEMFASPALRRTSLATRDELQQEEARLQETYKDKARAKAIESMKVKKAQQGLIYIDTEEAADRVFTSRDTRAQPDQLWRAQVNLWVTGEILRVIAETNRQLLEQHVKAGLDPNQGSVLNSAVKRLVKININEAVGGAVGGAFGGGTRQATGLTGRANTADYAVFTYRITVIMPTGQVDRLMNNLMSQNYHTVTNIQIGPIPRERNYYYGPEPVMMVGIDGEMLLLTKWIRPLMPPDVAAKLPPG
ncbi:MAG TPA: hypothetical protein VM695_00765 [Phycisphaerae bacterium]|nr:hypothetical protein [Phycisphaerae bacterium]